MQGTSSVAISVPPSGKEPSDSANVPRHAELEDVPNLEEVALVVRRRWRWRWRWRRRWRRRWDCVIGAIRGRWRVEWRSERRRRPLKPTEVRYAAMPIECGHLWGSGVGRRGEHLHAEGHAAMSIERRLPPRGKQSAAISGQRWHSATSSWAR